MADTYEKNLTQKSRLTTDDFIRVVGSDNVSYKQNVNNVNQTIPLNAVGGLTTEALIDQAYITAHTETPNRTLYRRLISHGFNHSIIGGGIYYLEGYKADSSYGWQRITSYGIPARVFIRSINNDTWTAWEKMPTRAEIDALTTVTMPTGISFSSKLSNTEITIRRCGKYVAGTTIFRADQALDSNGETILTGLPTTNYRLQVIGICVAGSEGYKAKRFSIYNGTLSTYWSATNFVSGDTWMVNFSYIATN